MDVDDAEDTAIYGPDGVARDVVNRAVADLDVAGRGNFDAIRG
jgi:ABC-type iron transport system FetAB ATPase subunit